MQGEQSGGRKRREEEGRRKLEDGRGREEEEKAWRMKRSEEGGLVRFTSGIISGPCLSNSIPSMSGVHSFPVAR